LSLAGGLIICAIRTDDPFLRQCMGRRRFESLAVLDPQVRQWNRRVNREQLRFRWGFTTTKARAVFKYLPRAAQNQAA
jgi:hypothetical protein